MKKKNLFYTLAASVMLAAMGGLMTACTSNDDNPVSPSDNNKWGAAQLEFDLGTTKIGAKFVEGGTYSMQYERDGVTKTVTGTLSDYYIGQYEVDNDMWYAVMGTKPEGQTKSGGFYPVSNVSYEEITKPGGFLDKANALLADQLPKGMKLMLPTEAQWHYAAMGGQKSKGYTYAGSNTLADVAWYADNADGTTHPVASKQPNELGLYDMSGNVWEWTSDWWADTADLVAEQGTDYAGPATGTVRTLSGGGWDYGAEYCAVSFRSYDPIDKAVNSLGFRLVLK